MHGRRKCLQRKAATKDQLEFLRLSASMISEICLEETGCEQVNWVCWAQNSRRRLDVGLCECGDGHSGYEAGRRFIGSLGCILLSSSTAFFCETFQIIYCHVLYLTTLSFPKINTLSAELNPICYLLALLVHNFLHVIRIRVKSLTLRLLMYIYIYIYI
jgi:hypothetical protein